MVSGKTDIEGVRIVMDAVDGYDSFVRELPFIRRHGDGVLIAFQLRCVWAGIVFRG